MIQFSGFWKNQTEFSIQFYGAIYNRDILGFATDVADTQIVEHIYKKDGYSALRTLDGAFLIIINDNTSTYIIRDMHGIASQVYYNDNCYADSLKKIQEVDYTIQIVIKSKENSHLNFFSVFPHDT